MMMRPQIAIIQENTLSAMALRSLLSDMLPGIDVVSYSSIEEFNAAEARVAHYFISANILFHNTEMFRPFMARTMVITEGEASPFVQSGFRTIDATASEQEIVRRILHIHHMGHPGHVHHHEAMPHEETTQQLLSARERDVLALLVKGRINKEIADELNISLATVIFHRNNIYEKLHSRSIGRLTIYAVLNNIVALSDI
jgi:DNA-binding CsgD family transcriptional regulator